MSRVYRALEKAERERRERLQKKTLFEKPSEPEPLIREELSRRPSEDKSESKARPSTLPLMDEVPILVPSDNPSAAEEFRKLKTQVFRWSSDPPHVILVTSAFPDEGKTIVSVNLAVAISMEMHKEAILIDADLRKPSVLFEEVRSSKGLSNYLADNTSLSEIMVQGDGEKLYVIPAGPSSDRSVELIGSKRMEELLKTLRSFGEDTYVIIDAPPLLATAEPMLLSRMVDGVILVVMADRTPRESVKRAIQSIDRQKIIGVVLNQKEAKPSSYYSHYYYRYHRR